jgi:hypothetical protein
MFELEAEEAAMTSVVPVFLVLVMLFGGIIAAAYLLWALLGRRN